MHRIVTSIFLNTFLASAVLAQPFYVGLWVADPAACAYPDQMLEFSESTYFGYEDTCALTNPVRIRDMDAILFDAVCRGEGGETTSRMLVAKEADGRIMLHHHDLTTLFETCE